MPALPTNCMEFTAEFVQAGNPRPAVITCAATNTSAADAATLNTVWAEALHNATHGPFAPARMSADTELVSTSCRLQRGTVQTFDVQPLTVTGTGTWDTPSPKLALVVQKITGLAGRQYRGRLFAPVASVDSAHITYLGEVDNVVAVYQPIWSSWMTYLAGSGVSLGLIHKASVTFTSLTSLKVNTVLGTMRKRGKIL